MQRRLAHVFDRLLELHPGTAESDATRMRRAHLAKYTKAALAGALAIFVAAGARSVASTLAGDDEIAAVDSLGQTPGRTKAIELLASAPRDAKVTAGIVAAKTRAGRR